MIFKPEQYNQIPSQCGIYKYYDKNMSLLYIGKAINLKKRVSDYFENRGHSPMIKQMVPKIFNIDITITKSEQDALILEQRLIQSEHPRYNIIFRDDKSYSYIQLTNHQFPQITQHRGPINTLFQNFGPFTEAKHVEQTIELIQKTFKIRSCNDNTFNNRSRPCVLNEINLCSAPCVNKISQDEYAQNVNFAKDILTANGKNLIIKLNNQMQIHAEKLEFEKAAKIRDQIISLNKIQSAQTIESNTNYTVDIIGLSLGLQNGAAHHISVKNGQIQSTKTIIIKNSTDSLYEAVESFLSTITPCTESKTFIFNLDFTQEQLKNLQHFFPNIKIKKAQSNQEKIWLNLCQSNASKTTNQFQSVTDNCAIGQKKLEELLDIPRLNHIECFDISHFNKEEAVGATVVYKDFQMKKNLYRLHKISDNNCGDDYASIFETVACRYQNMPKNDFPDLILIDGGSGQVLKAKEALNILNINIPIVGVAKGAERKVGNEQLIIEWKNNETITLDIFDKALLFIASIRDEAHRYCITQNRKQISKKRIQSSLLEISGIGDKKRKALLLAFKSIEQIKKASIEQLCKVPGINKNTAIKIIDFYQKE